MKKTNKKLTLNVQTIRALTNVQLRNAAGGVPPTSHLGGSYCCSEPCSRDPSTCTQCVCGATSQTCTQVQTCQNC